MSNKCYNCSESKEDGYDFCKECIKKFIRICTCNKEFIKDKPELYFIGDLACMKKIPEVIPDFFLTQISGNIFHIYGCRGCKHLDEPISVQENFKEALQASIVSCVYQRIEENVNDETKYRYEYASDTLDSVFEEYIEKQGIKVGEVVGIPISSTETTATTHATITDVTDVTDVTASIETLTLDS
jgi:hypothetical protein